jgi:hypothetical protein
MKLISDLMGKYSGQPILVIGGGPTAGEWIPKLPLDYFACVISANQHGFMQDRFKVDYIVSVDRTFGSTRTNMEDYLAKYNTPHINRWSWADYRIPEWSFNGDSGLTAIAVAAMLGGHPVVAIGIDRLNGNRRYFWQDTAEAGWHRRAPANIDNIRVNVKRTVDFCRDTEVMTADGPMRAYWRLIDLNAQLNSWKPHEAPQCHLTGKTYVPLKQIFLHPSDPVSRPLLMTDQEAKAHLYRKQAVLA